MDHSSVLIIFILWTIPDVDTHLLIYFCFFCDNLCLYITPPVLRTIFLAVQLLYYYLAFTYLRIVHFAVS